MRFALPFGGVLALVIASLAVAFHHPTSVSAAKRVSAHANVSDLAHATSRDDVRPPVPEEASPEIIGSKYATVALNLHTEPKQDSPVLTEIKAGRSVDVTGHKDGEWAQVVHDGVTRWVKAKFLSSDKPIGGAPCASGDGMESSLQPDTIRVHRAVCGQFPAVTRYLGKGGGEHATGRAVDIMVNTDKALGDAIAAFCQVHARELGVSQVIWRQRIWTVQRAGDGWRSMPDRGSITANHFNHVHVTTYGNAGTAS